MPIRVMTHEIERVLVRRIYIIPDEVIEAVDDYAHAVIYAAGSSEYLTDEDRTPIDGGGEQIIEEGVAGG
jgi:hypothetical protein